MSDTTDVVPVRLNVVWHGLDPLHPPLTLHLLLLPGPAVVGGVALQLVVIHLR